jgi:predicted amidohydrolase YtcJ
VSADPLDGIRSLVERRTESGRILGRNEAITVEQAVRSYTHGSAFAAGEESRKGRLAPGMLADMAILDGDIFSDDRAVRDGVSTTATVLAGSLVHGADELE